MFFPNCPCCDECPVLIDDDFTREGTGVLGPDYFNRSGSWVIVNGVLAAFGEGLLELTTPHPDGQAEQVVTLTVLTSTGAEIGNLSYDSFSLLLAYIDPQNYVEIRIHPDAEIPFGLTEEDPPGRMLNVGIYHVINGTEYQHQNACVSLLDQYAEDANHAVGNDETIIDAYTLKAYFSRQNQFVHVEFQQAVLSPNAPPGAVLARMGLPIRARIQGPDDQFGSSVALKSNVNGMFLYFDSLRYEVHGHSDRTNCPQPTRSCTLLSENYADQQSQSVPLPTTGTLPLPSWTVASGSWEVELNLDTNNRLVTTDDEAILVCNVRHEEQKPYMMVRLFLSGLTEFTKPRIYLNYGAIGGPVYYVEWNQELAKFSIYRDDTLIDEQAAPGFDASYTNGFFVACITDTPTGPLLTAYASSGEGIDFIENAINIFIPAIPFDTYSRVAIGTGEAGLTVSRVEVNMTKAPDVPGDNYQTSCSGVVYYECGDVTPPLGQQGIRNCFDAPEEMMVVIHPLDSVTQPIPQRDCTTAQCRAWAGTYFLKFWKGLNTSGLPWGVSPCNWVYNDPQAGLCQPAALGLSMDGYDLFIYSPVENPQQGELTNWAYVCQAADRSVRCPNQTNFPKTLRSSIIFGGSQCTVSYNSPDALTATVTVA